MRHRILTCKNHPNLRWSCKDIAWSEGVGEDKEGRYNGTRSIFFDGEPTGEGMYEDRSGLNCTTFVENPEKGGPRAVIECDCPSSALRLAPEDLLVKRD